MPKLPDVEDELRALWPSHTEAELARHFDMKRGTLHDWVMRLGLKKTQDEIRANQRRITPRGSKNPKWIDGRYANTPRHKRFADADYRTWRLAVLARDHYTCQECHRVCSKYERGLAAHHIKPYAQYPELRLEVSNGITMCRDCHRALHGLNKKPPTLIPCGCGCGTMLTARNIYGQRRGFVRGHKRPIILSEEQHRQRSESMRRDYAEGRRTPRTLVTWAVGYTACIVCGSTERPHRGHGLCRRCYKKAKTASGE